MKMNLRDVSKILAQRSSLSEGDVYAVVVGLVNLIPEMLMNGYTIKLDGLGSFRLHAKVDTSERPEDVNVRHIKELRISFRPDNEMKNNLSLHGITKAKR
jgi:predicted histone-like DNA-binding protein